MKKITALLLALLLLLLTGCGSGDSAYDETYDEMNPTPPPTENSSEATELTGELVLTSAYPKEYNVLGFYGELFQKEHPEVNVVYNMPETVDDAIAFKDKLLIEFYSDAGGDLLDMQAFDTHKLSHNGLLVDFYYLMGKDSSFNMDDYYTNVWEATEIEDKLFTLTTHFSYDLVQLNLSAVESIGFEYALGDSLNYAELVDLYTEAINTGALSKSASLFAPYFQTAYIDGLEMPDRFIDVNKLTGNFSSSEFIEYYNFTRQDDLFNDTHYLNDDVLTENSFATLPMGQNLSGNIAGLVAVDSAATNKTLPLKLDASNGNKVFRRGCSLSISALSNAGDLPWEFIKFVIEEKNYNSTSDLEGNSYYYLNAFDINRNNCINTVSFVASTEIAEYIDRLNNDLDTVAAEFTFNEFIKEIEGLSPEITPEELAKQLQEKADLYFSEF